MIRLSFDRKFVPLIAPFVAKQDLRYYLSGIRIEAAGDRPGVYIVGTDGHRMTIAYDRNGVIEGDHGAGVIMRMPAGLVSACKARSAFPLRVVAQGKRVSVGVDFDREHGSLETYVLPGDPWVEGNYPNWRHILPCWSDLKPGFASEVQPEYLADYARLGKAGGVVFWQANPSGPIIVQHTQHEELLSVLMPRRGEERDHMTKRLAAIYAGPQQEAA